MRIAPLLAVLLAAGPAFAAGRGGRAAPARGSRLSLSRPSFGRNSFAFGSFARTRFASRAAFAPSGFRSSSFSSAPRASRFSSATQNSNVTGNVPLTGSSGATRGTYGTPISGTSVNSTTIGDANGLGTQTVAAGAIVQNPGAAVDAGRSPGITWAAPDAAPSSGGAGGNGVTTNSGPTGF